MRPGLKHSLFWIVVVIVSALVGFYVGPFGFVPFAIITLVTIVLAIAWMRTYWDAK
jgi:hypothetical protein